MTRVMAEVAAPTATLFPANWYQDPWGIAPWRWWDGSQWTPLIYGPYGEAWPTQLLPPPPFVPKGPGIKGGGIAAIGAGAGVVASIAVAIAYAVSSPGPIDPHDPWFLLVSQLAFWVGLVGAVVIASHRNGTGRLGADYGLSWPRLKDIWLGLLGSWVGRVLPLIVLICIIVSNEGFGTPNAVSPQVLGVVPDGPAGWAVVITLAVFGAPLVEELFFRGLLQGAFTRRIGPVPALFATAFIFSSAHILNEGLLAPIALFPLALVLGYLRLRTGRLAAGMVAHSLFNAGVFLLFLIPAFR